jgi:hypothetical protein
MFAFAAFHKLYVLHADCKTAFLNSKSDLEMYLQQPEGFVSKLFPRKVLRLNKSLYGLKQAPRLWYLFLCYIVLSLGFQPLETDTSIYQNAHGVFLAVYVDDILIFGPNKQACEDVYNLLSKHIKMENLGYPKSFLGLRITRNANGSISIDQSGYIDRILSRFHMTDAVSLKVPLDPSLPLKTSRPLDKRADKQLYQELIGSIGHLAVFSRPDISNAVSQLSQFNQDPSETHMKAARHVLRYLKGTRDFRITYGHSRELHVLGFSDANWGGDINDRFSTTGYVFMVNNGCVSWSSHKQTSVATSTMAAEYMALSDASREAIARSQFYEEMRLNLPTPLIMSDNQSALDISDEPTAYSKAKHIELRYHFVRHMLRTDRISLDYVPSTNNPADVLTKSLLPSKHQNCIELLRLC